ncbi:MAG: class I SAM-dependent methyltransferase [candidate division KSB1 bacterium]|nr:class I SAM-dependent methyltransferase [candidate division KSB1 bacterium]MDZ7399925.1 class I SAM-dependent methyltransferase [candidate division KSB1 bacterium]
MSFVKQKDYYSHVRSDLLKLLPSQLTLEKVLDVGCGVGVTGQYLKDQMRVKEVVGIELNAEAAHQARAVLDQVVIGDIQQIELPFGPDHFDCIICADLLEHLFNPWAVLNKLKAYLKPTGWMLLSVPNVQHWSMIVNLLRGEWRYQHEGILDNTHIRFFTRSSVRDMVEQAGYEIEIIKGVMGQEVRLFNLVTLGVFSDFLSFRYFVLARKSNRK